MLNDIFYFLSNSERNSLKEVLDKVEGNTFTILKKFDTKGDYHESLQILNKDSKVISEINTSNFSHLAINRPYLVTKDHF